MLNIYHISTANEKKIGGPRFSVLNLVNHCDKKVTNNLIVSNESGKKYFAKYLNKDKIETYLSLCKKILRKEIESENSIFIFHSTFILKSLLLSLILRIYKLKYAIFPRGGFTQNALQIKKFKKKFFLKFFFKNFFSNAFFTIYLTNNEKIESLKFNNSFFISPNGVDDEFF